MLRSSPPRPALPDASTLAEIVVPDFDQRFAACAAVAAGIWGHGYRMCRTPLEQREWMAARIRHLERLLAACREGQSQ